MSKIKLNCQECGACCEGSDKGWVPLFENDIDKIDKDMMMKGDEFYRKYMKMKNGACVALRKEGKECVCTIYKNRPQACKDFKPGSEQCLEARSEAGFE